MSQDHSSKANPSPTCTFGADGPAAELVRVLDQYLADLQAGKAPDQSELVAAHPQLASRLVGCLAGIDFIHDSATGDDETPVELGDFRILREVGRGGVGIENDAD